MLRLEECKDKIAELDRLMMQDGIDDFRKRHLQSLKNEYEKEYSKALLRRFK